MPTPKTTEMVGLPPYGAPVLRFTAAKAPAAGDGPPTQLTLAEPADVEFRAADLAAADADGGDGAPALPTFRMVAHTFKPVRLAGWFHPVVVDAEGLRIPSQTRPIRYGHDSNMGVGHTTSIAVADGPKLTAEGVISRDTDAARDVVGSARNGFPWQASIGASVEDYEFVKAGEKVEVNGRQYTGPLNVARKTTLSEISFVDLGADDKTRARVAASDPGGGGGRGDDEDDEGNPIDPTAEMRQSVSRKKAELARQKAIQALIDEALAERGANIPEIEAIGEQALDEKWSIEKAQIALLRLGRARAPGVARSDLPTPKVLEASLCMALGIPDEAIARDRDYGEEVAAKAYPLRNRGLRGTIASALEASGVRVPHGSRELFDALLEHQHIRAAGFSTINLPGILGNTANKVLANAFTAMEATYPLLAEQADFSNFHIHSVYRLDALGEFEVVPADGEIKHARLDQADYTNQLKTYGKMLTISRQDIINDDLNSFRSLTTQLARKARIAVEKALYNAMMESVDSFYTTARGNKLTGSLGINTIGAAEAALMGMVGEDDEPIYATPRYLVVPPALKYLGDTIYTSGQVSGTSSAVGPADNPFRGRFQVVSSPYLASAALDGSSATTWYLLADPAVLPAFQVAFLDGRRAPTVETADAAFNTLGMSMRCYFDFGVAQLDYRGAIKNVAGGG